MYVLFLFSRLFQSVIIFKDSQVKCDKPVVRAAASTEAWLHSPPQALIGLLLSGPQSPHLLQTVIIKHLRFVLQVNGDYHNVAVSSQCLNLLDSQIEIHSIFND